jgi:hypothetical protein
MISSRSGVIADLKRVVKDNDIKRNFSHETIQKINQTIEHLKFVDLTLSRIDLLIHYGLPEDSFIRQCDEDSKLLSEDARNFLRGI